MPEIVLDRPQARDAFAGLLHPGRHGSSSGEPGLVVQERTGLAIVHVAAFRGQAHAVRDAVRGALGVALPERPLRVEAGGFAALWSGPEQWSIVAGGAAAPELEQRLAALLAGRAAVTAVGDGRAVLAISGPAARSVLAKGVAIDLDPAIFAPGASALTMASMIDVQLSRLPSGEGFELMLFRSLAGSLWHWLEETALETGIEVLPPG